MKRRACRTCPWRKSVPPGGFPGGCVKESELRQMASGIPVFKVMQCHNTPDGEGAKVCVGFAIKIGPKSVGFRFAASQGLIDEVEDDGDLVDSVHEVIQKHNTGRGLVCNPSWKE